MKNLFDSSTLNEVKRRVGLLELASERQWGKMDAAQALAHCSNWIEVASGDRTTSKMPMGRVLGLIIKPLILKGDQPMRRNSPTVTGMAVQDSCDLDSEKMRLSSLLDKFATSGPAGCTSVPHAFFGKLTADEWAILMYKHLDHHLRQFGV
jgi:hypothetical protein